MGQKFLPGEAASESVTLPAVPGPEAALALSGLTALKCCLGHPLPSQERGVRRRGPPGWHCSGHWHRSRFPAGKVPFPSLCPVFPSEATGKLCPDGQEGGRLAV